MNMTQAKHTPGPWHVSDGPNDSLRVVDADNLTIAQVFERHRRQSELEASARLIAAAPDLLDSLRWAIRRIETSLGDDGEHLERARAAVTKAERGDS